MTIIQVNVQPLEATGPGALAGFGGRCAERNCGLLIASSMESSAQIDARQHAEWHAKKGS